MASSPSSFDDTINFSVSSPDFDVTDLLRPSSRAGSDYEQAPNQLEEMARTLDRRKIRAEEEGVVLNIPTHVMMQFYPPEMPNAVSTWDRTYDEEKAAEKAYNEERWQHQNAYWEDHPDELAAMSDAESDIPANMDTDDAFNDAPMEAAVAPIEAGDAALAPINDAAVALAPMEAAVAPIEAGDAALAPIDDAAVALAPIDAHDAHTSACDKCKIEEDDRAFTRLEYALLDLQNDVLRIQARLVLERVWIIQRRLRHASSAVRRTANVTQSLPIDKSPSSRLLRDRMAQAGHLVSTTLTDIEKGVFEEMVVTLKGMADIPLNV
ncbi:hypothetical protein R3P38DRAFT_3371205 [Favolaschia claudopus]|uniref:Uncharacterized protein n=1 Tax=Favolaschia claudopus TaxID=2862362 RepID=A0AAV9ZZL1_9AGAR